MNLSILHINPQAHICTHIYLYKNAEMTHRDTYLKTNIKLWIGREGKSEEVWEMKGKGEKKEDLSHLF